MDRGNWGGEFPQVCTLIQNRGKLDRSACWRRSCDDCIAYINTESDDLYNYHDELLIALLKLEPVDD